MRTRPFRPTDNKDNMILVDGWPMVKYDPIIDKIARFLHLKKPELIEFENTPRTHFNITHENMADGKTVIIKNLRNAIVVDKHYFVDYNEELLKIVRNQIGV